MVVGESVRGLTSTTFHILMWIFLVAAIFGNTLVIVWRCSRKESRFRLISLLIVSLAAADLLWCCHYVLQEAMLFNSIFKSTGNETFSFTTRDERMCLASTFFTFLSCNAVMLTAVGIALRAVLSLRCYHYGNAAVYLFISISWMAALAVAASGTHDLMQFIDRANGSLLLLSRDAFSLVGMFGCMGDTGRNKGTILYPVIITSVNAAASVVCTVIYCCVCCKLKRSKSTFENTDVKQLQIRMTVIALANVVVWWPPCILYWYSYVMNETVFNGKLNPEATKPAFLLTVIVSAANPVIYTIASKSSVKLAKSLCCCHDNDETGIQAAVGSQGYCSVMSCCLCQFRSKLAAVKGYNSMTESTRSSRLFTE